VDGWNAAAGPRRALAALHPTGLYVGIGTTHNGTICSLLFHLGTYRKVEVYGVWNGARVTGWVGYAAPVPGGLGVTNAIVQADGTVVLDED
jgi:hypothetical protein